MLVIYMLLCNYYMLDYNCCHLTSILAAGFDLYIEGYGKYKTSFKAVECPTVPGKDGNIQFRFTGSNPWSMKLQARNSK